MAVIAKSRERTVPNYRQQVRRAIPDRYIKPSALNLLWIPFHVGIVGAGLLLLTAHFSWWAAPFLSLIIGHSFACVGFVGHDICHGSSLRNKFLRDLLGAIGFSPFAIGPHLWKRWHNVDHHNNTNIEGIDPDHLFTIEDYKNNPVLRFLYRISPLLRNIILFSSFGYRMTQHSTNMLILYLKSPKTTNAARVTMLLQWIVPLSLWVGGTLMLGTQVLWWGYLIPLFVANAIVISYIATNHFLNPLADENDVLATSLSVTLPRWLNWLDPLHSHFGAHVSHHLFPQGSSRYSRRIESKVAELFPDRFHVMPLFTALKLLWKTPWLYEDNETLIDPRRQIRMKTLGKGLLVPKKMKKQRELR